MKKILLLLLVVLLLTGCSAEYNLIYEDNKFNESLDVYSSSNETIDGEPFNTLVQTYYNDAIYLVNYNDQPGDLTKEEILSRYNVYNKELNTKKNGINLNYIFDDSQDYKNSAIVFNLFKNLNVTDTSINANGCKNIFTNYVRLDEIIIKFKTDKVVENSNADEVKKGIYYWYINKANYKSKNISIQLSKREKSIVEDIDISNYNNIIFSLLGIMLLISIILVCIKVKNSNKK